MLNKEDNKLPTVSVKDLKCVCLGQLTLIPDEEADSIPPAPDAKYFRCDNCDAEAWCIPEMFNIEDWYCIEEWITDEIREANEDVRYYL